MSDRPACLFHHNEICICGYSGSGKTTLATKLIEAMGPDLKVGYVKHNAQRFEIDREGKDTWRAAQSGASTVFISGPQHWAVLSSGECSAAQRKSLFESVDAVVVEGHKDSELLKIVMVDEGERIGDDIRTGRMRAIIAVAGATERPGFVPDNIPYVHRDDVEGIKSIVMQHWGATGAPWKTNDNTGR